MSLSVLRNYAVLPLRMAGSLFGNCAMTILHLLTPGKMFHNFLKETGLQEDKKYLDCVQNSVGDIAFFWPRLKAMWFSNMQEAELTLEVGSPAPNPALVRLSDGSECRLLDLAKAGRPLVINFGSCT
ncbi:thyroxine 5-deiodinase-like isoform X1 [Penaeus japonicus]|uniref:thyroxine 5-deiodinase-like isoform X1 n=1 Tax=Penaeus japonicus TaxID=27405 RepID=UPI001C70CAB1|nr:thyroxine 5-deiodinase-like isoform X1 [Penaeus japonicus]